MLKICFPLFLVFWTEIAFGQALLKSQEVTLTTQGEIYSLKIKTKNTLGLLCEKDDVDSDDTGACNIFIVKNGKKSLLASSVETSPGMPFPYVIAFTVHGDSKIYFFIAISAGVRNKSYTLIDEWGKNAEEKLLGRKQGWMLDNIEIDDATNTIATGYWPSASMMEEGLKFVFTPEGLTLVYKATVCGPEDCLTRTDSWPKNHPEKMHSELEGEPITAMIREKTFIADKPAREALTKKYLVPGDKVLVSDIKDNWIKITYAPSKTAGWITRYDIEQWQANGGGKFSHQRYASNSRR